MTLLSDRLTESIREWEADNNQRLTNTDFAKICNVSKQTVGDWIKGRTQSMTGEALLNGADYLGVNPRWLCSGTGKKLMPGSKSDDALVDDLPMKVNAEAADFAFCGIMAFSKVAPDTMSDPAWRQLAFTTLYRAWFNEETRRLGAVPLLNLVA